ncbi:TIR domain-containing protein [Pseudoscourfieldia marina]
MPHNEPGAWDVFISHTQRNAEAKLLATELYASLKERGLSVWLDVKMLDKNEAAMREGVVNSKLVIAVITDGGGVPGNAYFEREYCVKELRWAFEQGVTIQPVIRMEDKQRIGEFLNGVQGNSPSKTFAGAPEDLKHLAEIDWMFGLDNRILPG